MPEALSADPILSLAHPETLPDPFPAYARLRERPPFFYEPLDSWMFSRHADCVAVLRDSARFAADWRRVGEQVPPQALSMLTMDPPEHTAVRRLFLEAMRDHAGEALERAIAARTEELLSELARRPSFDVRAELAEPLALSATCGYLGVPVPDAASTSRIAGVVGAAMDAGLWPERAEPMGAAYGELAGLVAGWLADPPEHGVVGDVVRRAAESDVPAPVIANTVRALFFSGYSSGSKLLALALVAILHDRAVGLAELRDADIVRAVDELVRFAGPVQAVARACVTDTEVGGTSVRAGQGVTLLLGAANRDPARFPRPETVLPDRHPNPHLGFGRGPKSCLGSPFMAVFARVVLGTLADRHPSVRPLGDPAFLPNLTLRSLDRFEATLR
ncbi:cytochrome P450 [Streptomyces sp. B6B3]|uniref:cytochrome P450 n=1 Tax=Streptomyces sp. B6B3 TaxID=3153570 RepID=UPI00325D45C1